MCISSEKLSTLVEGEEYVLSADELRKEIATGHAVVLDRTFARGGRLVAIGHRLSTKVNVNIGTSPLRSSLEEELEKLKVAIDAGADTIMDLSTGGISQRSERRSWKPPPFPWVPCPSMRRW